VAEIAETLDLSSIYATYEEGDGRGQAAYDPRMMVRLLIYGYCRGAASSRRIERATYEDVALRYLAADQYPDHDRIADFRKEHLAKLSQLFVQVLRLCQQAGLVKLGRVALDGTKVKANASKHQPMCVNGGPLREGMKTPLITARDFSSCPSDSTSRWPSRPGTCTPRPSRPGEFHPEALTEPCLSLSTHTARATH
jgi:transposase